MLWVFDPEIEHIDPEVVYLFNAKSQKMGDQPKDFSRSILRRVEDEKSDQAQEPYRKWQEKYAADFLEKDKDRCLREKAKREQEKERRREEAKKKHEEYLKAHGKDYHGTAISNNKHRVTHCYS